MTIELTRILAFFALVLCFYFVPPTYSGESWRNYQNPHSPIYSGTFSDRAPVAGKVAAQYKIVSYNIHFSLQLTKIAAHFLTKKELKDADVIFLQEVTGPPGDSQRHAAHFLAQKLNYNYVYAPAFIHPENEWDFGVAILSKFPIRTFQKIILPHPHFLSGTQRVALFARLEVPGQLLDVISTHLETLQFSTQRIDQTQAMLRPVLNSTHPLFIAGDFNSAPFWQRWHLIQFMQRQGLSYFSHGHGHTGPARMKLDLAFGKKLRVLQSGILRIPTSDHDPIWFSFSL